MMDTQNTVIMQRHSDKEGNFITKQITNEQKKIINYQIVLEEIPHLHNRLQVYLLDSNGDYVNQLFEKNFMDKLTESTFKVDYQLGKVFFHQSLEGKTVSVDYWGEGIDKIHASRVYTQVNKDGEITETLDEMLDKGKESLEALYTIGDVIEEGHKVHHTLTVDINEGNKLHDTLTNDIATGDSLHKTLSGDIATGTELNQNLMRINEVANETMGKVNVANNILQETIDNTNEIVEKVTKAEGCTRELTQLTDKTGTYKTELTQLNNKAEELLGEMAQCDNCRISIKQGEWVYDSDKEQYKRTIHHALQSENVIAAFYDNDKNVCMVEYKILDEDNIICYIDTPVDFTVILNFAYRGLGINEIVGLNEEQRMNIAKVPNIENNINSLKSSSSEATNKIDQINIKIKELNEAIREAGHHGVDVSEISGQKLLQRLTSVDGTGSQLDSDMVDGHHASEFIMQNQNAKLSSLNIYNDTESMLVLQDQQGSALHIKKAGDRTVVKENKTTTTIPKLSIDGALEIQGGSNTLTLKQGNDTNQVYMEYYAKKDGRRSGYMGYGSAYTNDLTISNELLNGDVSLRTTQNGKVRLGYTQSALSIQSNAPVAPKVGDIWIQI